MSDALTIVVSVLAAQQIRAAEEWWRVNRPKAPTALQEDLDRASSLIAIQPELGARARNVALPGVRRLHLARIRHDLYFLIVETPKRLRKLSEKPSRVYTLALPGVIPSAPGDRPV